MILNILKHIKTGGLVALLFLISSLGFSQGSETFQNMPANASNYATRNWTGDNGETWTAVSSRTDQTINGRALTFNDNNTAKLTTTIRGGIGDLSLTTHRKFGSGTGTISVSVGGVNVGTVPYGSSAQTRTISGINAVGYVELILKPDGGARVAIDDVTWTSNGNTGPVITNIVQAPTTDVMPLETVQVSADISDVDGIASAKLFWRTDSSLSNQINMTDLGGGEYFINTPIPGQPDGTTVYYYIVATNNNVNPETTTSTEMSYTVNAPFPVITNILQNPTTNVTSIEDVLVMTDITSRGSITSAVLNWGTSSGNLTNNLAMIYDSNDTYFTIIDAQAEGTSVYYEIVATNSFSISTTSPEQSYAVINPAPVITNIIQDPANNEVTSTGEVYVDAEITDNNGIVSAVLRWGTTSGSLPNTITMSHISGGDSYMADETIPAHIDGTTIYYVIAAIDTDANPATTTSAEQSYTVSDPVPFSIPYFNGLRNQNDKDEALSFGFTFDNTGLEVGTGGYTKINAGGSIITPAIDFSAYEQITVSFFLAQYGGGSNQKLTVFVSNDNGANYNSLGVFTPPSANLVPYDQIIDLSSLNGTNGRIKFQMTSATKSVRFRDLDITGVAPLDGYVYNETWSPSDPSGISTASDNITIVTGTANLTLDTTVNNLTVNSGATLNIENVLTIAGNIVNNGNLIFKSTATQNGELAAVSGGSTIAGNVTVESYMSNNRSYRMVSSAVTTANSIHANWQEGATSKTHNPAPGFGTHITGTTVDQQNGFDATDSGNTSMFYVPNGTQTFAPIGNTDVNTLNAGDPYLLFVRGDRSIDLNNNFASGETVLRATGSLFVGTTTLNYATVNQGEFVMFGNPYQSAVDLNSVFGNATNVNIGHYYVYDPNLGDHGAYVVVNLPAGTTTGSSTANQYLQPGQGAQFATSANGPSTLTFAEADKAPGNFTTTSATANQLTADNMIIVHLYTSENYNNGRTEHDSFGIIFGEDFNNEITNDDAVKRTNFYENLGRDHNGTYLSIERRKMPEGAEVYQLYSSGYTHSDYTIKMIIEGLDTSILYLDDRFTGASKLLEAGENTYTFNVEAGNSMSLATDRFSIRAESRLGVHQNSVLSGISLFPNPMNGDTFYINAPKLNGEQLNVSISDLTGRTIYAQTLECRSNTVTVPIGDNVASGVYLVTLKLGEESQSYRLIKE